MIGLTLQQQQHQYERRRRRQTSGTLTRTGNSIICCCCCWSSCRSRPNSSGYVFVHGPVCPNFNRGCENWQSALWTTYQVAYWPMNFWNWFHFASRSWLCWAGVSFWSWSYCCAFVSWVTNDCCTFGLLFISPFRNCSRLPGSQFVVLLLWDHDSDSTVRGYLYNITEVAHRK